MKVYIIWGSSTTNMFDTKFIHNIYKDSNTAQAICVELNETGSEFEYYISEHNVVESGE